MLFVYFTDMAREFNKGHNILVDLNLEAKRADRVADILRFLARSRIRHAITANPPISQAILNDFWTNIVHDESVNPPEIRATVNGQAVVFTAGNLREILQLGTEEQENGDLEMPMDFIEGAIGRMGYTGDRRGNQFQKPLVIGQWRFLWHVMNTVFAPKKGGFDELSPALMSAVLSLVYNRPYSFCDFIFGEIVRQISGSVRSRFLIYPRFCMLIIRARLPDLAIPEPHLVVNTIDHRGYNAMFMQTVRKEGVVKPEERPLFGHILDPNYVTPPNNGWLDVLPGAVAAADAVPEPAAQEVQPEDPQGLLEDVLIQVDQVNQQVNQEVAAQLVQDVLVQNDEATDPLLRDIDSYVATPEVIFYTCLIDYSFELYSIILLSTNNDIDI